MNLTTKQWFQITQGVFSSLITAGALFTQLFGETMTLKIIAMLGLINIVVSSFGAAVSSQANLVKDVAAMPGVSRVSVNADANQALAAVATDPSVAKVGAADAETRQVLLDKAKGA